jgi:hypothetical protein
MKLQPVTLALLIGTAVLGGVVYFSEIHPSAQRARTADTGDLFNFEEREVETLVVTTPLRTVAFATDEVGTWQMTEPETQPANDASIAYLLNLMATGRSDRTLTVNAAEWESFGFHQPLADIEVTLETGQTHTLKVGEYDFNRSFLYAVRDAPENAPEGLEELDVLLVSPDFENAVSRPLSDWIQSPEAGNEDGNTGAANPTEDSSDPVSVESTESFSDDPAVE